MKEVTIKGEKIAQTSSGGQRRCRAALAAALCITAIFGNATTALAAAITLKKSPVKLIDTGLENMEPYPGPSQAAVWVNDHSLVAGVPLEKSAHDPHKIGRTVLYDLTTGKTRELMRYAHPICWDASLGRAGAVFYPNPDNKKVQEVFALRIDSEGEIIDKKPATQNARRSPDCDMGKGDAPALPKRIRIALRPGHGYLDLGVAGKGLNELAVLDRPDGRAIELPIRGRQVNAPRYLIFLEEYQLDSGGGCSLQGEKCPPDIHLLDPFGHLTVIAIPREVMEIMPIQRVHVVKNGLLFRAESRGKREGYLLLRDGVLHELWRPGSPGLMSPQRTETWGFETISPDGCKVAFARGVRPSRVFVFDHCAIGAQRR
ncbi:MAG: hypothetical protein Q7J42_13820 [Sulfuritalea sp.]|nr:hypothetical protein [Sulfuritalea sp.]